MLTYLLVGTMVFSVLEGWSPRDALYFCVTALTTVGYGDLVPTSSAGKLFCCAYLGPGSGGLSPPRTAPASGGRAVRYC